MSAVVRPRAGEAIVHLHPAGPLVALVGSPNCGKTALFNLLTGSRQKVANYAGVTVERKEGRLPTPDGRTLRILDLPGVYSLYPRSPDERVTRDVLTGTAAGEKRPDRIVCVVDATNLRRGLRLVLAVQRLGLPCLVALNMADRAERLGIRIDDAALARELGVPVVRTVGVRAGGDRALRDALLGTGRREAADATAADVMAPDAVIADAVAPEADHLAVQSILERIGLDQSVRETVSDRLDRITLHPVIGPLLLSAILFVVFQAVFAWAEPAMQAIEGATAAIASVVGPLLPEGWLRSLVVEGVIAGAGGVLVFLPQILILFLFILALEDSGYLPRAAFLLDRLMGRVGLSGRSFIPLLSSFACAIPGIMAARTIPNPRDRLVTILIAPLMTCSARLPVYALLIGAFIPARTVGFGLQLQGIVLFGLYVAGIVAAMAVAWSIQRIIGGEQRLRPLMMEMPAYHWPTVRHVAIGLWQRAMIFLKRVGGIILALTIVLWFLASFPGPPANHDPATMGPAILYSFAGQLGQLLAHVFEPVGFNWQISIALVPGLAAREVMVSSLGTVYALSAAGDAQASQLASTIATQWAPGTAYALLAWFVFAPQCIATLAAIRRETGGLRMALVAAGYLFVLAWIAAFVTWQVASRLAGG
ncbi:MAG: ferrous iron transporter B [Lautropia sp.]